jgi:hypothetical protein
MRGLGQLYKVVFPSLIEVLANSQAADVSKTYYFCISDLQSVFQIRICGFYEFGSERSLP